MIILSASVIASSRACRNCYKRHRCCQAGWKIRWIWGLVKLSRQKQCG